MSRKKRSDAKLFTQLSSEQQDALADWLLQGVSYERARQLVEAEFGVTTSKGALGEFYHSYCGLRSLERRRDAANYAAQIAKDAEAMPSRFNTAAIELLQQRAFEMLASPKTEAADIKALFAMVLADKKLDLDNEKLKQTIRVYEETQAKAKAALESIVTGSEDAGLSPETLAKIERALKIL